MYYHWEREREREWEGNVCHNRKWGRWNERRGPSLLSWEMRDIVYLLNRGLRDGRLGVYRDGGWKGDGVSRVFSLFLKHFPVKPSGVLISRRRAFSPAARMTNFGFSIVHFCHASENWKITRALNKWCSRTPIRMGMFDIQQSVSSANQRPLYPIQLTIAIWICHRGNVFTTVIL